MDKLQELENKKTITIGIISDTHGILREKVEETFKGCDLILHAGDIGKEEILNKLQAIAPLAVVRGNNDKLSWCDELEDEVQLTVAHKKIYMIHDLKKSKLDFEKEKIDCVITGHSHIYKEQRDENILYLNPGAAGPKRFGRPVTAMLLCINTNQIKIEKIDLS